MLLELTMLQTKYENVTPIPQFMECSILDVEKSKSVLFVKRSLSPGYAGIDNDLFYR